MDGQELRMAKKDGQAKAELRHSEPPAHPAQACAVLVECYDDGAGAEALLRAFLAERNCDRPGARYWITVHGLIADKEKQS